MPEISDTHVISDTVWLCRVIVLSKIVLDGKRTLIEFFHRFRICLCPFNELEEFIFMHGRIRILVKETSNVLAGDWVYDLVVLFPSYFIIEC